MHSNRLSVHFLGKEYRLAKSVCLSVMVSMICVWMLVSHQGRSDMELRTQKVMISGLRGSKVKVINAFIKMFISSLFCDNLFNDLCRGSVVSMTAEDYSRKITIYRVNQNSVCILALSYTKNR